jgi:NTP pyrophosphatase (non-canonical NTP hydrolase)
LNIEKKPEPSLQSVQASASVLTNACHSRAFNAGWWHDIKTGERLERNVPEMLCLIHSEISEALEGYRKDAMDDKLTHRKMIEVELADAAIRIFDLAGGLDLDIGGAMAEKMKFNAERKDHKIESRKAEGGKKI